MKGDWVQGTQIYITNTQISTIAVEGGEPLISGVTVSYSVILPSGTVLGYNYQANFAQPLPQSQAALALSNAIAAAAAYEGLVL